jgi:3' exoribonuclease family, domain 1
MFVRRTLEQAVLLTQYPRMLISVIVQVLSDDGGVLSTAINGAAVALLNAGIFDEHSFCLIALLRCKANNMLLLYTSLLLYLRTPPSAAPCSAASRCSAYRCSNSAQRWSHPAAHALELH